MNAKGTLALVSVVAVSGASGAIQHQASAVGGFTELYRAPAQGEPEIELGMGLVERTDQATSPKHYHPSGEFGFMLQGSATILRENGPPLTLQAGSSFYQPAGEWHVVKTGPQGARTVVFRMVRKGDPTIVELE